MTPQCLQPLCQWLVCIKTGMVFPTQSYFRVHSCPFVSIRVHSCPFVVEIFPDFASIRVHSCPFVVQIFPVFVFFVCFVCFVVHPQHSCPFVSIRGSNIPRFRFFRVFRGSGIPRFRVHSWSRPAGFRKKSGFWRDGTFFPEYIKSAMDPRGFSSKTATLQQG